MAVIITHHAVCMYEPHCTGDLILIEAVFLFQSDYRWWCGDGDGISATMLEINWIFDSWADITSD